MLKKKEQLQFLGHVLTKDTKLSVDRVQAILGIPKPVTVKYMLSFLKMCSYCKILQYGDKLCPVVYFSSRLDPVAAGLPMCLRAVAAAERAVVASRDIVG